MVSHETLWDKNTGDIMEHAVIPDAYAPAKMNVTIYDCDPDLKEYANTLLCDGDEAIAIMTAEDRDGNYIELDLRVRGEVRVGYRTDINDDFEYYSHFSQYPLELTEMLQDGNYDEALVDIADNNWLETVYRVYDKNGEEQSYDGIMFEEDISEMTVDTMKAYLRETASNIMECEYAENRLDKPATQLVDIFRYANMQYEKGNEITLPHFPNKNVQTVFEKDPEIRGRFSTKFYDMKNNKLITESPDHGFADFFNHIMYLATGEEKMGDKKLKDVLKPKQHDELDR